MNKKEGNAQEIFLIDKTSLLTVGASFHAIQMDGDKYYVIDHE